MTIFNSEGKSLIAILGSVILLQNGQSADNPDSKNWQVYCSPKGGCTETIADTLGTAKRSVLVQAYSFTSAPIAKALVECEYARRQDSSDLEQEPANGKVLIR